MLPNVQRGKHTNRSRSFSEGKNGSIIFALLEDNSLITLLKIIGNYLPEDLNLYKMHSIYLESHPGELCSRESYR